MADFCSGKRLWDSALAWTNTSWPEFTPCFQSSILELLPCVWLLLVSPFYLAYLTSCHVRPQPCCWHFSCKLITAVLLASMDIIYMIMLTSSGNFTIDTLALVIWAACLVLYISTVMMERSRHVVRSFPMFTFTLLSSVNMLILVYNSASAEEYHSSVVRFTVLVIRYILTSVLFFLSCFAEFHGVKKRNHNPESSASALSWIAYTWLEPFMRQGYKKPLQNEDIYDLNPEDTSANGISRFLKNWDKLEQPGPHSRTWFKKSVIQQKSTEIDESTKLLTTSADDRHIQIRQHYALHNIIGSDNDDDDDDRHKRDKKQKKRQQTFFRVIVNTFWWEAFYSNLGIIIYVTMNLISPYILGWLINYSKNLTEQSWHGYIYMLALLVSRMLQTIFNQSAQFLCNKLGIRVRSTAIAAIFRKAMNMSSEARKGTTMGEIVNLMSVDTNHLELFLSYSYWLWTTIIIFFIAPFLLYNVIGLAMLAGMLFICLMLCVNVVVTQFMRKFQEKMMQVRDRRLKMVGEVLQGIKVIKLYGWEPLFIRKILTIRNEELKLLFKYAIVDGIDTFAYTASTFWITFFILITYIHTDPSHYLDPQRTFLAINFIYLMRMAINGLPIVIRYSVKMATSIRRIDKFLQSEDLDPDNLYRDTNDAVALRIMDADFAWEKSGPLILKNINLEVKPGQLVAVVGSVGAGKSSLLSALLGEMYRGKGYSNVNSSIAYVPQQAWIQNNTVKENILFGQACMDRLYSKVINACALKQDLEILPAGDLTEIGEKGINLSGGQKQRVSLARAVYSQADIYLFDDPLSAVDSQVGKHIFRHVIGPSGLLKNKTRILVTHGLQWLPDVDQIVVIHEGEISEFGTFESLLSKNGAFANLLSHHLTEMKANSNDDDSSDNDGPDIRRHLEQLTSEGEMSDDQSSAWRLFDSASDLNVFKGQTSLRRNKRTRAPERRPRSLSSSQLDMATIDNGDSTNGDVDKADPSKLTSDELLAGGKVNWGVYLQLLKAYGIMYALITAILILGFHTSYNVAYVWLTHWTDDRQLANFTQHPANSDSRFETNVFYIKIYAVFGIAQTLCCMTYSALMQYRHVTASRLIHAELLDGIMRAPMSFFDTTPMGRILNRFSQDLDVLDSEIFLQLEVQIEHGLFAVGILVIVTYTFPVFALVLLPVVILFYFLQQYYVRTSCQLRRIASTNRSPVFAHFSEALSGVSVIRAHQHQARFMVDSEAKVDKFQSAMSVSYAANKWMQTRLDIMTYVFILAVTLFTTIFRGDVQPGLVGLSVTFVLMITYELTYVTRTSCELETNVVSVERIREYTSVVSEAPWNMDDDKVLPQEWPSSGKIEFIGYSTRYREGLDLVLNSVSFTVQAGEKIGIVGRTGAGKSSMVLSLFRLVEAASGRILIDGVDISKIGLHSVRRNLTILPQDPVLFAGTLRMNIDPFDERSEDELWQALEHAHLKPFVEGLPQQLDHDVGEGGENLSMGQRQLVCLARTLLRKTKVLILDEATAAVDVQTDELIQKTIKTAFSDCTVLTIAHRINTVMDYDKIMVLQSGQVIEFDTPDALLRERSSVFHSMARQAGLVIDELH